ncbi:hypothetical protein [Frankia gtarii]|uniref:hypothetical protein n=1 Tax=Frankia gtarii TaxID=2950102 RepID=UPI0021C1A4E8|nr:hypothetical protein [Frankia gtarii]
MSVFTADDPVPVIEPHGDVDPHAVQKLLVEGADVGTVLTLASSMPDGWAGAGRTVDAIDTVPDGCVDGVIAIDRVTAVPVRPLLGEIARVLRVGGWARLVQADPARAVVSPVLHDLTVAERREIDGALFASFPHHRGPLARELIWSARGVGLLPTRLHLGFGRRVVSVGDVEGYLCGAPADGVAGPLDRIIAAADVGLADRYAEAWERATAAGPVTVWTPGLYLAVERVADTAVPQVRAAGRRGSGSAASIRNVFTAAEWPILTALEAHGTQWDGLRTGRWAAPW